MNRVAPNGGTLIAARAYERSSDGPAHESPLSTVTCARDEEGEQRAATGPAQRNPHLKTMMKWAGVTAEHLRDHGPRAIAVLPNLRELADATDARGG